MKCYGKQVGGEAERKGEGRLLPEGRARHGSQSHSPGDHDLSQNKGSDAQPMESPRCPPDFYMLNTFFEVKI